MQPPQSSMHASRTVALGGTPGGSGSSLRSDSLALQPRGDAFTRRAQLRPALSTMGLLRQLRRRPAASTVPPPPSELPQSPQVLGQKSLIMSWRCRWRGRERDWGSSSPRVVSQPLLAKSSSIAQEYPSWGRRPSSKQSDGVATPPVAVAASGPSAPATRGGHALQDLRHASRTRVVGGTPAGSGSPLREDSRASQPPLPSAAAISISHEYPICSTIGLSTHF